VDCSTHCDMAVRRNIPHRLHLYTFPRVPKTMNKNLTRTGSLPVLRPALNVLRGRSPISRSNTTGGGGTTSASNKHRSGNPRTWPSFSVRNQYADIESDSTHELTKIEHGKAEVGTAVLPVNGNETGCARSGEVGKGDVWKGVERDAIRKHTDIEVKVVQT